MRKGLALAVAALAAIAVPSAASAAGYRSGKRCVSKRPKRGRVRRCTIYRNVGSFTHNDAAGANRFHFTGRVKRRPLRVGRYRLRAIARNSVGQISRPLNASFRIVAS